MENPKVYKRTITPDILKSRERDIEIVLDNYRENLREQGVTDEEAIERFVMEERNKIQQEYESLDKGDCSSNIYVTPTNWSEIASQMQEENKEENEEEMSM